jgi:hypothetical protein
MRFLYCLLLCIFSTSAWAVDFLHITCIPESRYFGVEFRSIDSDVVFTDTFNKKIWHQQLSIWKRKGYFDASSLKYECRLPDTTFEITSSEPKGSNSQCGAATRATINLKRNGKIWFNNVFLGIDDNSGCDEDRPGIMSFSVVDKFSGGGWMPQLDLCMSIPNWGIPKDRSRSSLITPINLCESYGIDDSDTSLLPLKQNELTQYFDAIRKNKKTKDLRECKLGACKLSN